MDPTTPRLINLRTDHLPAPLALPRRTPRFAWQIVDARNGDVQLAYAITIAAVHDPTAPRGGEPVATATGRVESADSVWVEVPGFEGAPGADYRWTVRVWLASQPDPISAESTFGIAETHWEAAWVEPQQQPVLKEGPTTVPEVFEAWAGGPLADRLHPPRYIRQPFVLPEAPVRARLQITSQGVNRTSVNGRPVSDNQFEPGYESYQHEISVVTHDIGTQLTAGENVLGVVLADGWYAGRISLLGRSAQYGDMLRATWQIDITYPDGSSERILPNNSVRSSRGPIDWSDIFIGERYDARREIAGWDLAGFDDDSWDPADLVQVDTQLHPCIGEPVRPVLELPVREILNTPQGEVVLDFGQVIAGRVRMRVRGDAGTTVRLEHSEVLDRDGNYFTNITGANKEQTDEYVLSGDPAGEEWEPAFTFHGFRYVRLTGYPGALRGEDFTAVVLANDLMMTADLRTSDPRINQLVSNARWSQRGNFLAIPTDCPQRERAGWTGDLLIFAPTAATLMNVGCFLDRWLRNVRIDQRVFGGMVPDLVPLPPEWAVAHNPIRGSAGWGDVITVAPRVLYDHYADDRFLADNIEAMRTWVDIQTREAREVLPPRLRGVPISPAQRERQELLWNGVPNFGDWLAPSTMVDQSGGILEALERAPRLTSEFTGPAFQVMSLDNLARTAQALGDAELADRCRQQAQRVRAAFAVEYVGDDGRIGPHMQGVYVLALAAELVPEDLRAVVAQHLVDLIHGNDDHLDTGFASVSFILDTLWDSGHQDVARTLLFQDTIPSWLYQVRKGATTIWESWDVVAEDRTVDASSLNHYAFGCVVDWLMRRVAGITLTAPGYRTAHVAPDLDGPLTSCSAHVDTPYGRLGVEWERTADRARVVLSVPVGVEVTFAVPTGWSHGCASDHFGSGTHRIDVLATPQLRPTTDAVGVDGALAVGSTQAPRP